MIFLISSDRVLWRGFFLYSKSKLKSINSVRRALCTNNVHNIDNVENRSRWLISDKNTDHAALLIDICKWSEKKIKR